MAVVSGRTAGGLRVAALPTLGIRFNYYAADDLKPLVVQYVQNLFRQRTPAQIAEFLLPPVVELDDIVVQFPREMREREEAPEIGELAAVADPLTSRELRMRFGRAWGREELVNRFAEILAKQSAPILLLGEGGVGKTSVLRAAVVPGLLLLGYLLDLSRSVRDGHGAMPAWDRRWRKIKDGFAIAVLFVIWSIPGIVVSLVGGILTDPDVAPAVGPAWSRLGDVLSGAGNVWQFLVLVIQMPVWAQYARGGFGAAPPEPSVSPPA